MTWSARSDARIANVRHSIAALRAAGTCFAAFCLSLLSQAAWAQQAEVSQEYRLKAAFIYNFSQFIEWPANAFAAPDSPFSVCVLGDDPFGDAILALQKRNYQGRRIVVSYPKTLAEARSCRILYVDNPSKSAQWRDIGKGLSDVPVLTVSSGEDAMGAGVCIGFLQREGKIRWALNLNAARKAQLRVSAKLIEIAVAIVGEAGR